MITEALKKEIWEHRLKDLKELRDLLNLVIREKEKIKGVKFNGSEKSNRIYKRE